MVSIKQTLSKNKIREKVHKSAKIEKPKKKLKSKPIFNPLSLQDDEQIKQLPQDKIKDVKIKKKGKFIMPTKSIKDDLVDLCLNALQLLAASNKKKNTILDDESPIFAVINCIKIQSLKGNIKFVLPHSTIASTGEVCFITPDIKKGRKHDHEPTVDRWEELLRNAGVTTVKTVLPMRQLKVEYDQFELKRRLLTQHDFIMVDTRVLTHVSHLLGKMFFKKHNMLIPVRINESDIKKSIDIGLRSVMLRLSEGSTSTILVGHTGMQQDKVKENILSLVEQLHQKYPGGEANIRSISIKLPLSLSLPLYLTLRPSNTIDAPKLKQRRPKNFSVLEDELSTIPDCKVRVAPDGTVHLKRPQREISVKAEDIEELDDIEDSDN